MLEIFEKPTQYKVLPAGRQFLIKGHEKEGLWVNFANLVEHPPSSRCNSGDLWYAGSVPDGFTYGCQYGAPPADAEGLVLPVRVEFEVVVPSSWQEYMPKGWNREQERLQAGTLRQLPRGWLFLFTDRMAEGYYRKLEKRRHHSSIRWPADGSRICACSQHENLWDKLVVFPSKQCHICTDVGHTWNHCPKSDF